eukprot:scaffold23111_cov117-Isochrysis_galbana.AAC.6
MRGQSSQRTGGVERTSTTPIDRGSTSEVTAQPSVAGDHTLTSRPETADKCRKPCFMMRPFVITSGPRPGSAWQHREEARDERRRRGVEKEPQPQRPNGGAHIRRGVGGIAVHAPIGGGDVGEGQIEGGPTFEGPAGVREEQRQRGCPGEDERADGADSRVVERPPCGRGEAVADEEEGEETEQVLVVEAEVDEQGGVGQHQRRRDGRPQPRGSWQQ